MPRNRARVFLESGFSGELWQRIGRAGLWEPKSSRISGACGIELHIFRARSIASLAAELRPVLV